MASTSLNAQQHARIQQQLAAEIEARGEQVQAAIDLLDGGATVPFIARYRKEATDNLTDVQLRELESRLTYLRELEERRVAVTRSIAEQGKLTSTLTAAIEGAPSKQELEDLYAPYKPRRRTKGAIAREAGLEPLADRLWADPLLVPATEALAFVDAERGVADVAAALEGVRDLLSERWAEDAVLVGSLREWLWSEGHLVSALACGKDVDNPEIAKFRDYFEFAGAMAKVPSYRALAVFRGRTLEILDVRLRTPSPAAVMPAPVTAPGTAKSPIVHDSTLAESRIAHHLGWRPMQRPGDALIARCVAWTWRVKLSLSLERDLFVRLRLAAEDTAIKVFADNLRHLLLAAPAGKQVVMGLDPGIRTGVKAAVVGCTGRVEGTATVYPHEPRRDREGALQTLTALVVQHGVGLIAIGNGTASRETDALVAELLLRVAAQAPDQAVQKLVVSEAGASVYSASEIASRELPDMDVSLRGAVSIARRLQDPLAELVKIDPRSIGVGQYQHDVNQTGLTRTLTAVVEDCVNAVGVDVNTASAPLLAHVSGLGTSVAEAIVRWRDQHGAFVDRKQLRDVPGLGARTFEQAAGFLRIADGANPLDASGVHPETYPVVQKMLEATGRDAGALMGASDVLRQLAPETFVDARFGLVTVKDILRELEKPGRDPRPVFKVARLIDGVTELKNLLPGMRLEGTVTNVAQFGAFVDLGVHHDGLIHVSQLADRFVRDAREVVKTGDVVQVRVVEVDNARKRVSLTMRRDPNASVPGNSAWTDPAARAARRTAPAPEGAMALAFARLRGQG